jgi:hypothetical protein
MYGRKISSFKCLMGRTEAWKAKPTHRCNGIDGIYLRAEVSGRSLSAL